MPGAAARTWDGRERALDDPQGSTVVVRRHPPARGPEFLLLHRAVEGADYIGDWAWTAPAGCRYPGEPVYPAALRELTEAAGIGGYDVWSVDLTGPVSVDYQWSVFALDVPLDQTVTLHDPEHDRFAWLGADEAMDLIRPRFVGEAQVRRLVDVPARSTSFRPMREGDLSRVATWWRQAHASQWFHGDVSDEEVRNRLLPRVRGDVPTRMWVYEVDGVPAGYAQTYRVSDHPDYAAKVGDPDAVAFDYLLGEAELLGRGLGTRMVWELCRDVMRRDHPGAAHFIASPSHRNSASLRVLRKCGFAQGLWIDELAGPDGTADTEVVCTLDVRHYFG